MEDEELSIELNRASSDLQASDAEQNEATGISNSLASINNRTLNILSKYGLSNESKYETDEALPSEGVPDDYLTNTQIQERYSSKYQDSRLSLISKLLAAHNELIGNISINLSLLAKQALIPIEVEADRAAKLESLLSSALKELNSVNSDVEREKENRGAPKNYIIGGEESVASAVAEERGGKSLALASLLGLGVPLVTTLASCFSSLFSDSEEEGEEEEEGIISRISNSISSLFGNENNTSSETAVEINQNNVETNVNNLSGANDSVVSLGLLNPISGEGNQFVEEQQEGPRNSGVSGNSGSSRNSGGSRGSGSSGVSGNSGSSRNSGNSGDLTRYEKGGELPAVPFSEEVYDKGLVPKILIYNKDVEPSLPVQEEQAAKLDSVVQILRSEQSPTAESEATSTTEVVSIPPSIKVLSPSLKEKVADLIEQIAELRRSILVQAKNPKLDDAIIRKLGSVSIQDYIKTFFPQISSGRLQQYDTQSVNIRGYNSWITEYHRALEQALPRNGLPTAWAPILISKAAMDTDWGKEVKGSYNFASLRDEKGDVINFHNLQEFTNYYIKYLIEKGIIRVEDEPNLMTFAANVTRKGEEKDSFPNYLTSLTKVYNVVASDVFETREVSSLPTMQESQPKGAASSLSIQSVSPTKVIASSTNDTQKLIPINNSNSIFNRSRNSSSPKSSSNLTLVAEGSQNYVIDNTVTNVTINYISEE